MSIVDVDQIRRAVDTEEATLRRAIRDYRSCPIGEWMVGGYYHLTIPKLGDTSEIRRLRSKLRDYEECPLSVMFDV